MKDWRNVVLIIFALCLIVGGYFALQEHDARIRSEATIAAIKANTQQEVKTIEVERKAADTPQKQIQYIEKYVPVKISVPVKPDDVEAPALNPSANALDLSALPTAAGYVQMPTSSLPVLSDYVENCNKSVAELKGCRAEVEEYKKQKGGFWHKVGGCGLRVGLGALGGLATNNRAVAIGGGAAGGATCFIWKP